MNDLSKPCERQTNRNPIFACKTYVLRDDERFENQREGRRWKQMDNTTLHKLRRKHMSVMMMMMMMMMMMRCVLRT